MSDDAKSTRKRDKPIDGNESNNDYIPPPSGLRYKEAVTKMKTRNPQEIKKTDYYRPISAATHQNLKHDSMDEDA